MLETIYVTRHGFRSNWVVDNSGTYRGTITSPTGIESDPPLAAHGVDQARQLAAHIATLDPKVERIYTSPFYRCLETINPTAEQLDLKLYADNGIGEWYGVARFDHPSPATPELLHTFFPRLETTFVPSIIPSSRGESLKEIHDRTAYALAKIISDIDKEWAETGQGPKAILLVTHAATKIAIGRALTGSEDLSVRTGTCSLSTYRRRTATPPTVALPPPSGSDHIPDTNWRGNGVGGGWDLLKNGDCSFLRDGEERHWEFNGEESWDFPLVKEGQTGFEGSLASADGFGLVGGPGTIPEAGKMADLYKEEAKI
ncbi:C6 zinc cluster transcription factor-like protein [Rhizina undulata]